MFGIGVIIALGGLIYGASRLAPKPMAKLSEGAKKEINQVIRADRARTGKLGISGAAKVEIRRIMRADRS